MLPRDVCPGVDALRCEPALEVKPAFAAVTGPRLCALGYQLRALPSKLLIVSRYQKQ